MLKKSERKLKKIWKKPQTLNSQTNIFENKKKKGTPQTETWKIRVQTENWESQKAGETSNNKEQKYGTTVLSGITYPNFFSKLITLVITHSSSRPEVFCKKGVLRIFARFTGKHLRDIFWGLQLWDSGKRLWNRCLPVNFAKFLGTSFFLQLLWWLLLNPLFHVLVFFSNCSSYFLTISHKNYNVNGVFK